MAWVLKMDDATIESGLVHDFDASLTGIGQELGAGAYSMRLENKPRSGSWRRTRVFHSPLRVLPFALVVVASLFWDMV